MHFLIGIWILLNDLLVFNIRNASKGAGGLIMGLQVYKGLGMSRLLQETSGGLGSFVLML